MNAALVTGATPGFPRLECFLQVSAFGASCGRTLVLVRSLRDPEKSPRIPEASSDAAIIGGTIGILLMLGAGLLGLRSLPEWTEVPAVVIATQVGFSLLMGRLMNRRFGPLGKDPKDPTYEQVAFALFGAITLPGTALFILVMTLLTTL